MLSWWGLIQRSPMTIAARPSWCWGWPSKAAAGPSWQLARVRPTCRAFALDYRFSRDRDGCSNAWPAHALGMACSDKRLRRFCRAICGPARVAAGARGGTPRSILAASLKRFKRSRASGMAAGMAPDARGTMWRSLGPEGSRDCTRSGQGHGCTDARWQWLQGFFHYSARPAWRIDKRIEMLHVPRAAPCSN